MDRGACWAMIHGATKSDTTERRSRSPVWVIQGCQHKGSDLMSSQEGGCWDSLVWAPAASGKSDLHCSLPLALALSQLLGFFAGLVLIRPL